MAVSLPGRCPRDHRMDRRRADLDDAALAVGSRAGSDVDRLADLPADRRHGHGRAGSAEGHSNLTYVVEAGGQRAGAAPPAGRPAAADRARRRARVPRPRPAARSRAPVRVPRVSRVCEDDGRARRAVLPDGAASTASSSGTRCPAWLDRAGPRRRWASTWRRRSPRSTGSPSSRSSPPGSAARAATSTGSCAAGPASARASRPRSPRPAGGRGTLPDYDAVRDWLRAHLPAEAEPAVVHGDYKLDNVVVPARASGPARIAARARLGDGHRRRPARRPRLPAVVLAGAGRAASARRDLVTRSGRRASRPGPSWSRSGSRAPAGPPATLTWFVTLAIWKLAVLLEASYHRHLAGTTDDPFFATPRAGRAGAARACPGDLRCLSCARCVVDWGGVLTEPLRGRDASLGRGRRRRRSTATSR